MSNRNTFLIYALLVLIAANVLMIVVDSPAFKPTAEGFAEYMNNLVNSEKFTDFAGAKDAYVPMGKFDGLTKETGNPISNWRFTSPNEPLLAPQEELGPDNMFMFKNNQCKPSCCGASYSCSGGCVCTTPDQREFINTRGGNRTRPDPGV